MKKTYPKSCRPLPREAKSLLSDRDIKACFFPDSHMLRLFEKHKTLKSISEFEIAAKEKNVNQRSAADSSELSETPPWLEPQ